MKKLEDSINRAKKLMLLETTQSLSSPLDGSLQVTSPFGAKRSYEVHPGVDLRARERMNIKSPLDGEILTADMNANPKCGGTIDVKHPDGYWSRFCHVSQMNVRKGDIVKQGQVLGLSGGDAKDPGHGNSRQRHLHWTLKKDGKQVDPMKHLGASVTSDIITGGQLPPEMTKELETAKQNPELEKILNLNFKGQKVSDLLSPAKMDWAKELFIKFMAMMKD